MLDVGVEAEDVDDQLHFCFNFAFNRGISVIGRKIMMLKIIKSDDGGKKNEE